MKKYILIFSLCLLMAGCGANTKPASTETSAAAVPATTETSVLASTAPTSLPETETVLTEAEETLPLSWDAYQVVYNIMTEGGEESGVFQGIDPEGSLIWSYETDAYPLAQFSRIQPAGRYQGTYYLIEDGSIIGLDIATGRILFENTEFKGAPAGEAIVIDEYGYLYLAGCDTPDFFAMDSMGRTVKRISSLSDEYCMPFKITLDGDQLTVYMESDCRGNCGAFPVTIPMDWLPQAVG